MRISETQIPGAFLIEPEPATDERGFFARAVCRREFDAHGIPSDFVQSNISFNNRKGLLRGMHYQCMPHEEGKLVRCTRGAIFDVIVDLRPNSRSFKRWEGFALAEENANAIYIPPGLAHGFVTLTDKAEVFYQMTTYYVPSAARGVRWNDPNFAIRWPISDPVLSVRDAQFSDFSA